MKEVRRTPFEELGKPEDLKGCWSRSINGEHRLVYRVTATAIIVLNCKGYYE